MYLCRLGSSDCHDSRVTTHWDLGICSHVVGACAVRTVSTERGADTDVESWSSERVSLCACARCGERESQDGSMSMIINAWRVVGSPRGGPSLIVVTSKLPFSLARRGAVCTVRRRAQCAQ